MWEVVLAKYLLGIINILMILYQYHHIWNPHTTHLMQPSGGMTQQMQHLPWCDPLPQVSKIGTLTVQRTGGVAACRQVGMPRTKLWKETSWSDYLRKMGIKPHFSATKVRGDEKSGLEHIQHCLHPTCHQLSLKPCLVWAPWNPCVFFHLSLKNLKSTVWINIFHLIIMAWWKDLWPFETWVF